MMRTDESFLESTLATQAPSGDAVARLELGTSVRLVRRDGTAFDVLGKGAVVTAMVALDGRAERSALAAMLWPSSPDRQARNNLRTLVHRFNQRAGAELLIGGERLHFDPRHVRVVTQNPELLAAALDSGAMPEWELLAQAGVDLGESDALAQWVEAARQRTRHAVLSELADGVAQAHARRDFIRGATLSRACIRLDPLSERWHRQLMELLAEAGDRAAALAAYEDCKVQLLLHLGVLPDAQTRKVHLRILQGAPNEGPVEAAIAEAARAKGGVRIPLVERDDVLAQARSALDAGQHVSIEGEAGVGKTRLLGCLHERPGVDVFEVRAGLRDSPYAAVAQWLQQVQETRGVSVATADQIELARICPQAFPGVEASHAALSPLRLHDAFRHWMDRLAGAGVKLLAIDDVHHADGASQAVWAALLDTDGGSPALLLAHRSADIAEELEHALVAAQVKKRVRRIFLPRLSAEGVRQVLQSLGADRPEDWLASTAARLHRRTGGNPLFVVELARHECEATPSAPITEPGHSLQALLQSRVQACSPGAQQLAALAAVAGEQFSVELAARVLGLKPLAMMPSWNELQQRGLFADDGLAHDMVRDAVQGSLPSAIVRSLHREVASFLEGLGLTGALVLGHWRAGGDLDRALPHAVHALHADGAAGLDTTALEQQLLDILSGVSDATLLGNLWLSAEIHEESMPPEGWSRIEALLHRVRASGQTPPTLAWVAYETARLAYYRDNDVQRASDTLQAAAVVLPPRGVERARAELLLLHVSQVLDGHPGEHAFRARQAVAELGEVLHHRRLQRQIENATALFGHSASAVRAVAARLRAARQRGDASAADEARVQLATIQSKLGNFRRAQRHVAGAASQGEPRHESHGRSSLERGFIALNGGLYDEAWRCLAGPADRPDAHRRHLFLALWHARVGQPDDAVRLLERTSQAPVGRHVATLVPSAILLADLSERLGGDPLHMLEDALAAIRAMRVGHLYVRMVEWEVRRRTAPLPERAEVAESLIAALKSHSAMAATWLRPLIECAEVHAELASGRGLALAREAASALRRGYASPLMYTPDALLRCARLLWSADAPASAALTEQARAWVLRAIGHVPPAARPAFVAGEPSHRALLVPEGDVTEG